MHFYSYDEWYSNTYYSKDSKDLALHDARIVDVSDLLKNHATIDGELVPCTPFLTIRSCWKNPKFISTYTGTPSIDITMPKIDVDIGCLYKLKEEQWTPGLNYSVGAWVKYEDGLYRCNTAHEAASTFELDSLNWDLIDPMSNDAKKFYRSLQGCVQTLNKSYGAWVYDSDPVQTESPYVGIVRTGYGTDSSLVEYFNNFTDYHKEVLTIDLRRTEHIDEIIVFQSIYSGAISFREASSCIEIYASSQPPIVRSNRPIRYSLNPYYNYDSIDYKFSTCLNLSDSLMIAALRLKFNTTGTGDEMKKYMIMENISQFVYGHVDMDDKFDWGVLWQTFQHPADASMMIDSIMHYSKE